MAPLDLSHPGLRVLVEPDIIKLIGLPAGSSIPTEIVAEALTQDSFFSMTRTAHELSILATDKTAQAILQALPAGVVPLEAPSAWKALKIAGPLDLSMVGILHEFTSPLADAQVAIFASSTFLTDYVLVKEHDSTKAVNALKDAGWQVAT